MSEEQRRFIDMLNMLAANEHIPKEVIALLATQQATIGAYEAVFGRPLGETLH